MGWVCLSGAVDAAIIGLLFGELARREGVESAIAGRVMLSLSVAILEA